MFEKLKITAMAQAMAAHAGARMGTIASNVANADTPGYRTQDLADFGQSWAEAGGDGGMRATRAGHLGGAASQMSLQAVAIGGHSGPDGNSVSLEAEMVKAVEVRQQHDMALAIYRNTSSVIRTSLGRQ